MGEHLPCKQGVESSNLLVSICNVLIIRRTLQTYLENRILKIQINNEKTSEVYAAGRQCRQKNEEFFKKERNRHKSCNAMQQSVEEMRWSCEATLVVIA